MSTLSNPSEIARETLRQLAMRRVAPTPDNYRKLYHEIAGTRGDDNELPEAFVRKLARRLPRDNAERQRHVRQLEQALADGKPKAAVISRANEIVRAIGLRPITGLSGPKIGY